VKICERGHVPFVVIVPFSLILVCAICSGYVAGVNMDGASLELQHVHSKGTKIVLLSHLLRIVYLMPVISNRVDTFVTYCSSTFLFVWFR